MDSTINTKETAYIENTIKFITEETDDLINITIEEYEKDIITKCLEGQLSKEKAININMESLTQEEIQDVIEEEFHKSNYNLLHADEYDNITQDSFINSKDIFSDEYGSIVTGYGINDSGIKLSYEETLPSASEDVCKEDVWKEDVVPLNIQSKLAELPMPLRPEYESGGIVAPLRPEHVNCRCILDYGTYAEYIKATDERIDKDNKETLLESYNNIKGQLADYIIDNRELDETIPINFLDLTNLLQSMKKVIDG